MSILIVNCLLDDELISDFDLAMARLLGNTSSNGGYAIRRITNLVDCDVEKYTHLILSGSEASAMDDNPWDEKLAGLITAFVNRGSCILGICYGHQFIVRALVGREHLRKRYYKVWGWIPVSIMRNPLFEGITDPIFLTVNSDEVFNLPVEFKILASVDHCQILAYQYAGHPIWGVQFHPEYTFSQGNKVIQVVERAAKPNSYSLEAGLCENSVLSQNAAVFKNFLKAIPSHVE